MNEYLVYFKTGLEEGFEKLVYSKSLLGAKQRATRDLKKFDSKITALTGFQNQKSGVRLYES
ncbi:hypothetical protein [Leptospira interrogans]|uniref:hypothetical protein n=1 Tax=Leptospira interrogans TaxID=173 RepID=UPI000A49603D|nr:hypothetical protein [Leptospira interrogans]